MTHAPHYAKALKYAHADHAAWVKSVSDAQAAGDTNVQRFYADWLEDRGHPLHHLVRADADRRDRVAGKVTAGGQVPWDEDAEVGGHPVPLIWDDPVVGRRLVFVGGTDPSRPVVSASMANSGTPHRCLFRGPLGAGEAAALLDHMHEAGARPPTDSLSGATAGDIAAGLRREIGE